MAIIDKLVSEKGLQLNQESLMLAGFSSGSLNIAAINSCFRVKDPNSWEEYYKKDVLFKLKDKDVFSIFPRTVESILNTAPLRKTLDEFLLKMQCMYFGDFAFDSFVLAYSHKEKDHHTQWAFSKNNGQNLKASDLFMSSTAIPIVFPTQTIEIKPGTERNFPEGMFSDGGTQGTFIYFEESLDKYIADNGSLDTLHVVSPMRQTAAEEYGFILKDIKGHDKNGIIEKIKDFLSKMSMNSFLKFVHSLNTWNKASKKIDGIYISIPQMEHNFPILNFADQEKQYNAVTDWFGKDEHYSDLAVPIEEFVKNHPLE